ncbi:MAG: TVP38/TMEM64 family protein [Haloferacaceae archaeon]
MDRRARIVVGALAALAVLAAALTVSPRAVLSRLDWLAADPWRFAAALLVLAAVRPLLAWPTTLLAVVVGYGYGIAAVPVALALIVATSLPPYLLARRGRAGGRFSTAGERVVDAAGDLRSMVVSRLLPAPSDVVSVGAGVAGIGIWPYVLGTAVGETPWALAGVLAGASVDRIAQRGLAAAFDVRLVAAAALVALGLSFRPVYRWLRERN